MAVGVVLADRDHRQTGSDAVEQRAQPGVVAAVVGDLEDVDRTGSIGTDSASASAVSSIEKRRQRATMTSARRFGSSPACGARRAGSGAARARRGEGLPDRSSLPAASSRAAPRPPPRRQAGGDPARRRASRSTGHRAGSFRDPARVVGLVMRDDEGAERADAGGPQHRGDAVVRRPGVDQDRCGAGRLQQDRVALADVEDRDAQAPRGGPAAAPPLPRAPTSVAQRAPRATPAPRPRRRAAGRSRVDSTLRPIGE